MTRQEINEWKKTKPKHIKHVQPLSNNVFIVQWNNTWEKQTNVSPKLVENYLSKVRRNKLFQLCENDYYQRETARALSSALWS